VFFGYELQAQPYCRVHFVNAQGDLFKTIPINLPDPVMMHDFALTQNYVLILDFPCIFSPKRILEGKGPFYFNSSRPTRFGVLPRNADSEKSIKWINATPRFAFHVVNSWEETSDTIVLMCCASDYFPDSFWDINNMHKADYSVMNNENWKTRLFLWKLNLTTNSVEEKSLDETPSEFPTIHPQLYTKKTRYGYTARVTIDDPLVPPTLDAVIKYDLENIEKVETCGIIEYGTNKRGGECSFVPRSSPKSEDDGYLMTYVYDEEEKTTELWIMDALKMKNTPLARIVMPQRVPYGFHGIWLPESDIEQQRKTLE